MAVKEKKIARAATPATLPEGWRVVRFDEMAQLVNDRVDNPSEAGVERYVGLEHLDPESLKIRRWGSPDDVEAQKLRFQPGDIIFGKRRAYQRKLAVADFEGICSAHAMVLRAREETVVKDFLPFFMQGNTFFERALSISVGSLSPTINWKTLASQEFVIPSRVEQQRIAEILLAADDTLQSIQDGFATALIFKNQISALLLNRGVGHKQFKNTLLGKLPDNWMVVPLSDLTVSSAYGPRFPAEWYTPTGNVQTIRTTDFDRKGGLITATAPSAKLPEDVVESHKLQVGDFLVSRSGAYAGLTAVFKQPEGTFIAAAFVIRFRLNEKVLPDYLKYLFYSDFLQRFVLPLSRGSAQPNISGSALLNLNIPVPPADEQLRIVSIFEVLEEALATYENHLTKIKKMADTLREHLLNPFSR